MKYSVWDGNLMSSPLTIDVETDLQPFHTRLHKLVTFQAYDGKDAVFVMGEDILWFLDMHKNHLMVMQNAPFDMSVLAENKYCSWEYWFKKIDAEQIHDTKLLYTLLVLATIGEAPIKNSLKTICANLLGIDIEKGVERITFAQYLDRPFSDISEAHLQYGIADAIYTYDVYIILMARIKKHDAMNTLLSHNIQIKGALALDQIYKNGIKVDHTEKQKVLDGIFKESDLLAKKLSMWGYVKGKKGNKQVLFKIIEDLGFKNALPLTAKSKQLDTSKDVLEPYADFSFIADYLRYNELEKASGFIVNIKADRIHPRYTTILTTGRTSCSGANDGACNIQQLPRVGGIREIFIPKEGHTFVNIDYSSLEMAVLAGVLLAEFGESRMAEAINAGHDLHKVTAASIYKKEIHEVTKEERQQAKPASFGFPSNMGAKTFIGYAKGYGLSLSLEESQHIKDGFNRAYPEINYYFSSMRGKEDGSYKFWNEEKGIWDEKDSYEHMTLTGRKRAKCTYTAYLNAGFQGLAADGAKIALFNVLKAGYTTVAFVHDEILVEVKSEMADTALTEISKIMVDSMRTVIKNVDIAVEGSLKERYSK